MSVTLFTDGACSGNPGPGGWGLVAVDLETEKIDLVLQGREEKTTNNAMELTAIIKALELFGVDEKEFSYPVVYTDSNYAFKTLTEWYQGWKRNGWKRPKNQPVANLELIKKYDELWEKGRRIELRWVRGHNGNKWNEVADKLATGKYIVESPSIEELMKEIYLKNNK